jgi:hypothetical protein
MRKPQRMLPAPTSAVIEELVVTTPPQLFTLPAPPAVALARPVLKKPVKRQLIKK